MTCDGIRSPKLFPHFWIVTVVVMLINPSVFLDVFRIQHLTNIVYT